MRLFYLGWPISQTVSAKFSDESRDPEVHGICHAPSGKSRTLSAESFLEMASKRFPLPWSAYVRLLSVKNEKACAFYETEALRGGWSVRQLDRQINSQFYERTSLSKNKATMLKKAEKALPEDIDTPGRKKSRIRMYWSFSGLKTNTRRRTSKRRSSATWRPSCWSLVVASVSLAGRNGCESETSGIAWIWSSFTENCAAW